MLLFKRKVKEEKKKAFWFRDRDGTDQWKDFDSLDEWKAHISQVPDLNDAFIDTREIFNNSLRLLKNVPKMGRLHHLLILLHCSNGQTNFFVTMEKSQGGVYMQVSINRDLALRALTDSLSDDASSSASTNKRPYLDPTPVCLRTEEESLRLSKVEKQVTVKEFFNHLVEQRSIQANYNLLFSNCQGFVDAINGEFDKLLKSKILPTNEKRQLDAVYKRGLAVMKKDCIDSQFINLPGTDMKRLDLIHMYIGVKLLREGHEEAEEQEEEHQERSQAVQISESAPTNASNDDNLKLNAKLNATEESINESLENLQLLIEEPSDTEYAPSETDSYLNSDQTTSAFDFLSFMEHVRTEIQGSSKRFLVIAAGGYGKTTASRRLALEYCLKGPKVFDNKDVFRIDLKEVKDNQDLVDALFSQYSFSDWSEDDKKIFRKSLLLKQENIFWLLDSFDECQNECVHMVADIFKGVGATFSNSIVMLLSRLEGKHLLNLDKTNHVAYELQALSKDEFLLFISKYPFSGDAESRSKYSSVKSIIPPVDYFLKH